MSQLTYTSQVEGGVLRDDTLAQIISAIQTPLGPGNNGITALAGGAQLGATQLQLGLNRVVTVVTAADSVLLPPALPGAICIVINSNVTNAVAVFPTGTDVINALADTVALSVAATVTTFFFCAVAGKWNSK